MAAAGLLTGALTWGLIWYPYRLLEQAGVSGALSSFFTYLLPLLLGLWAFRRELPLLGRFRRALWLIALTAGWTNLAYVLAILHGEVMRVLLLFYLSPLWTLLFARLLLNERAGGQGAVVMALSLCGAVVMLWQPQLGMPLPRGGAEWLGLSAGVMFALSNVLSRQAQDVPINLKSVAVWAGVAALSLLAAFLPGGQWAVVGALDATGWGLMLALGGIIFAVTLTVQYGLTHTPANQAIVIFLFELVVAAVASYFLANESLTLQEWVGGAMIVAATVFSGRLEGK